MLLAKGGQNAKQENRDIKTQRQPAAHAGYDIHDAAVGTVGAPSSAAPSEMIFTNISEDGGSKQDFPCQNERTFTVTSTFLQREPTPKL